MKSLYSVVSICVRVEASDGLKETPTKTPTKSLLGRWFLRVLISKDVYVYIVWGIKRNCLEVWKPYKTESCQQFWGEYCLCSYIDFFFFFASLEFEASKDLGVGPECPVTTI